MQRPLLLLVLLGSMIATSCSRGGRPFASDRLVAIEVEVYDPNTNEVWENVAVRVVEADQEWSGCLCVNPVIDDWYFTDVAGRVFLSARDLAIADVGFQENGLGRAVLSPRRGEDQATVLLEITAPGLGTVFQEVDLSWDDPSVIISVPL